MHKKPEPLLCVFSHSVLTCKTHVYVLGTQTDVPKELLVLNQLLGYTVSLELTRRLKSNGYFYAPFSIVGGRLRLRTGELLSTKGHGEVVMYLPVDLWLSTLLGI